MGNQSPNNIPTMVLKFNNRKATKEINCSFIKSAKDLAGTKDTQYILHKSILLVLQKREMKQR